MGINKLVNNGDEEHDYMTDLQTQRKRLLYPNTMTRTSNEFGRLVFPGTSYVKKSLMGRNHRTNLSFSKGAYNSKDTPYNGNWSTFKKDPSSIETPAGMRLPIGYYPGSDMTTSTELPMVQRPKQRYSKDKKIGLMIEEENKRLMRS